MPWQLRGGSAYHEFKEREKVKERTRSSEIESKKRKTGGEGGTGFTKWLLRDQPCVRLASGDVNTSDAAGATIPPFTAGEEISVLSQKGRGRKR